MGKQNMVEQAECGLNKTAEKPVSTQKPSYEPPRIVTYTAEDILEKIGPAGACSPYHGCGGAF